MPSLAKDACKMYLLPENPTNYDLETGYTIRGAQIVECNGKRQLAVETHETEHRLEAQLQAIRAELAKPFWHFWPVKVATPPNK